jgi:predicted dehydrogenase
MTKQLQVGVLGAGMIATFDYGYLPNLGGVDKVKVVAIADTNFAAAQDVASRFGIPQTYRGLDEMLAEAPIDAVLNLTPIPVHAQTSLQILEAGKHLASEKPFATTLEDADAIIKLAAERGLTIVSAPPHMLYPSRQTARRLINEGVIGKVAFARVRSSHNGPAARGWPADPTWFYQEGAGPLLDMGVYGLHEITGILGAAKRVFAMSGITEAQRVVKGGPFDGKIFDVTADDNTLVMLDFGESTFAVVDATFNVAASKSPKIELFGREGTLNVNLDWSEFGDVPALEVYGENAVPGLSGWITPTMQEHEAAMRKASSRGQALVLEHLADCVVDGTAPILSAEHARHVLEIMIRAGESARSGASLELTTTFGRVDQPASASAQGTS